jgi:hypothetical protein
MGTDNTSVGHVSFRNNACFKFWRTCDKLDIEFVGWRLAAYWRERGMIE